MKKSAIAVAIAGIPGLRCTLTDLQALAGIGELSQTLQGDHYF
jgi:hypothetical protein